MRERRRREQNEKTSSPPGVCTRESGCQKVCTFYVVPFFLLLIVDSIIEIIVEINNFLSAVDIFDALVAGRGITAENTGIVNAGFAR